MATSEYAPPTQVVEEDLVIPESVNRPVNELYEMIGSLNTKIANLNTNLGDAGTDLSGLQNSVRELFDTTDTLTSDTSNLKNTTDSLQNVVQSAFSAIDACNADIKEIQETIFIVPDEDEELGGEGEEEESGEPGSEPSTGEEGEEEVSGPKQLAIVKSVNGVLPDVDTGAVSIDVGVKKVNNTAPDGNGNVSIAVPQPMPVGALYIQFPGYSAPADLFGGTWTDVTSTAMTNGLLSHTHTVTLYQGHISGTWAINVEKTAYLYPFDETDSDGDRVWTTPYPITTSSGTTSSSLVVWQRTT